MPAINLVLGVDQTGAQHPRRPHAARPLAAAVVFRHKNHWQVCVSQGTRPQALQLQRIDYDSLITLQQNFQEQEGPLIVTIDCVLGMPQHIQYPAAWGQGRSLLLRLFLEASHFHHKLKESGKKAYGLSASSEFFREIQRQAQKIDPYDSTISPQRQVELLLKANSVFREHPFQKNIQSGTFRIWSDLGSSSHLDRIHIWPFDDIQRCQAGDVMLMECYPSHLWRVDWGIGRRNPERLIRQLFDRQSLPLKISDADLNILLNSLDHCDALVNALGFLLRWQADSTARLHPACPLIVNKEGWILGAESQKSSSPKLTKRQNCYCLEPVHC